MIPPRTRAFIGVGLILLLVVFFMAFIAAQVRDNSLAVQALEHQNAEIRAEQQAQAQAFSGFLREFVAEVNYVCSISQASAARNGLPPAPPGTCSVLLPTAPAGPAPTPRPTARPTERATPRPSVAPTAAPSPTKTPCPLPLCLSAH